MRVTIQRVTQASVKIDGSVKASIGCGYLLFLGICEEDDVEDIDWLCTKISDLRIFSDESGKMNKSIKDVNGAVLLISQFTLYASIKKGTRPSFIHAASPDIAKPLYHQFKSCLETKIGTCVETGEFGANMSVSLCNDGPVTINIDSKMKE